MHRGFHSGDKTRAHVHALRAQSKCGHQRTAIGHAAGRDKRDFQFVGSARQQDEVGDIVFTGVTAALKSVNAERVTTYGLRFERVAHRGAFVNHFDTGGLQSR